VKPVVLVPTLLLLIGSSASAQSVATPPLSRSGSPLPAASSGAGATAFGSASVGQGGGARSAGGAGADATSEALVQTVADISGKAAPGARDYRRLTEATLDFARRKAMGGEGFSPGVITSALDAVDAGEALDRNAADWPTLRKELEAYLDGSQEPPPPQPEQQQDQQKDQNQQPSDPSQQNEQQEQQQQNQNSEPKPGEPPPQNGSSANDAKSPTSPPSDPSSGQSEPPKNPENRESAFGNMQRPPSPPPTPPPGEGASAGDADRQPVGGQPPRPSSAEGKPELAMPLQKLDQVKQADSPAKLFRVMEGKPTGPATGKKGQTW
jgi:Ca-activated chloride channel family protein